MNKYFEKCAGIISNTTALPPIPLADQFFSYHLCPPLVKDWHHHLDFAAIMVKMPKFPWLQQFHPLMVDPTLGYSSTVLQPVPPEVPAPGNTTQATQTPRAHRTNLTSQDSVETCLFLLFNFYTDSSQVSTPSSKISMLPATQAPPPILASRLPASQWSQSMQWQLFDQNLQQLSKPGPVLGIQVCPPCNHQPLTLANPV